MDGWMDKWMNENEENWYRLLLTFIEMSSYTAVKLQLQTVEHARL